MKRIDPTASATVYGRRPKFFRAEHSATDEGEKCSYGPTLINKHLGLKIVNMVYSLSRSQTNAKCDKLFFGQLEHGRFDDVLSKHKF